ncbi:hypothetical protein AGR1B_pa0123 [Agrobacterium fabacearum S56]|nr:hypothetical protein AGR1B_pa0123 [Agrobacterium fabacearum S56]
MRQMRYVKAWFHVSFHPITCPYTPFPVTGLGTWGGLSL